MIEQFLYDRIYIIQGGVITPEIIHILPAGILA